jgi:hypothetical protein
VAVDLPIDRTARISPYHFGLTAPLTSEPSARTFEVGRHPCVSCLEWAGPVRIHPGPPDPGLFTFFQSNYSANKVLLLDSKNSPNIICLWKSSDSNFCRILVKLASKWHLPHSIRARVEILEFNIVKQAPC